MAQAQPTDKSSTPQPQKTALASGIDRLSGTDPSSHIQYVRLILKGSLHAASAKTPDPPIPDPLPILIAQCTLRPNGKHLFDIFTSFGGATDLNFYPPWKSAGPDDKYPPVTDKVTITMDFLGYTHVKPARRRWEIPTQTPAMYRYNSPGGGSPNLEDFSYYLRFLLVLPTLRLTLADRSAEFLTTPLLDEVRKEPLCRAAGL